MMIFSFSLRSSETLHNHHQLVAVSRTYPETCHRRRDSSTTRRASERPLLCYYPRKYLSNHSSPITREYIHHSVYHSLPGTLIDTLLRPVLLLCIARCASQPKLLTVWAVFFLTDASSSSSSHKSPSFHHFCSHYRDGLSPDDTFAAARPSGLDDQVPALDGEPGPSMAISSLD